MGKYSIIVPIYNEQDSVVLLCKQIKEVMDKVAYGGYEIIIVNDGSTDKSLYNLKKITQEIKELNILNLDKNYGQSLALQAGFDISSGEIIITLDGDLQDNPDDIPRLLDEMNEGYDVVCGFKKNKHTKLSKIWASRIANYIRRSVFKEKIHDVGCTFRVYKRNALAGINIDGCKHRFLTAILAQKGAKISEVTIKSHPRLFGTSKYYCIDRAIKSIPEILNVYFFKDKHTKKAKYCIKEIIKYG